MSEDPSKSSVAHPGLRESFVAIEARAREVLRGKGFSEEQIERQLSKARREEDEDWLRNMTGPADDDGGEDL